MQTKKKNDILPFLLQLLSKGMGLHIMKYENTAFLWFKRRKKILIHLKMNIMIPFRVIWQAKPTGKLSTFSEFILLSLYKDRVGIINPSFTVPMNNFIIFALLLAIYFFYFWSLLSLCARFLWKETIAFLVLIKYLLSYFIGLKLLRKFRNFF